MEPPKKRQRLISDFAQSSNAAGGEASVDSVPAAVVFSLSNVASATAKAASPVVSCSVSSGVFASAAGPVLGVSSSGVSSPVAVGVSSSRVAVPVAVGPRKNVGGASKLEWFNTLAIHPDLEEARKNLFGKIASTTIEGGGCIIVNGFKDETRPTLDKSFVDLFKRLCPDGPARFSPYHIALLKHKVLIPDYDPPPYPSEHRMVKQKRQKSAAENNEKAATWVASHLCHNRKCINAREHLCWEPSWFNRLRDNCPGGDGCVHRPRPCLRPHRDEAEIIDWSVLVLHELSFGDPKRNS